MTLKRLLLLLCLKSMIFFHVKCFHNLFSMCLWCMKEGTWISSTQCWICASIRVWNMNAHYKCYFCWLKTWSKELLAKMASEHGRSAFDLLHNTWDSAILCAMDLCLLQKKLGSCKYDMSNVSYVTKFIICCRKKKWRESESVVVKWRKNT